MENFKNVTVTEMTHSLLGDNFMIIDKKRIRSIENNIPSNLLKTKIVPGIILDSKKDFEKLKKIGFTSNLEIGESLLPSITGPITRFNSNGKEIIDRTKPKEKRSREIEWCWNQWAGRGKTERVCDFKIITYERFARVFIDPPSVEIQITKKEGDKIYITTSAILLDEKNYDRAVNQINVILEVFGSCYILSENLIPSIVPTKKLNWNILPPGKRPWNKQKELLKPVLDLIKDKRVIPVIESRLENINNFGPEFTASGNQGFKGYIVFGFPKQNIYVLESALYGNAIYIFNEKWEELSKKTKAEIIQNKLQIERITHNGERLNWIDRIKKILK